MTYIATTAQKHIALVAHDNQKNNLLAWAKGLSRNNIDEFMVKP